MLRVLIIFIITVTFSACLTSPSPDYSWTPESLKLDVNPRLDPPETLSTEQTKRDIGFLKYALLRGYGGREFVPDGKLDLAIKMLDKTTNATSPVAFKDSVDRILLSIPDNHLVARLNGTPSPDRLNAGKEPSIGKNAISSSDKVWEVDLRRTKSGQEYLFVSITKFPSYKDDVWNGFLDEVKALLGKSKFLVLDLRGNGGGDDTKGLDLAEILNGGPIRYPVTKQYVSQTPETLAIFGNNIRLRSAKLSDQGKKPPPYFSELLRETDEKYAKALAGELPEERIRILKGKGEGFVKNKGYKKRIYILIDKKCGSSCESTVDGFEWHPYAKLVGENTAGCLHFGNIGYVVLPESKIQVQIPTHYNEYYDNRFIERTGIEPDLRAASGTDALAVVLQEVESEVLGK